MKKLAFHTLGCKVNQVETEQIKEEFSDRGYQIVDFDEPADIYIINTCTVTHVSDRKSRAMIRRAIRRNPAAVIVATGCVAQVDAGQLASIEGIDLVVGNNDKENLVAIVEDFLAREHTGVEVKVESIGQEDKPRAILYQHMHERARAFVKIQDGCQSFCTYCIVPYARGPVRSKQPEDVLREITHLVDLGYREIVLTGIHTGFYGVDLNDWNLHRLLTAILEQVRGQYRIRLSSLEPLELEDRLLELIADDRRICRHLHIPLQSGSNNILKKMGRRYDSSYYLDLIQRAASKIPGVALAADVMVGFPSETQDDFAATYDLIEQSPLADLHVFKYSRRAGTRAAEMKEQVDEHEKQRRSELLIELARKKQLEFVKQCRGQSFDLLVEQKIGIDKYTGITDNYIEIVLPSTQDIRGQLCEIILTDTNQHGNFGQLCIEHN
ncbi:Methylthiotransferase [Syntrophomonas zehnderi OL-4]|uniref:Threonylcarbamoyladenosine tRNA methylthiotransferase MtaB n=1 Tax=Syntrophomonas zehnderi OL-4 TaxID=690567 RepID=A0A0E4GBT9_9FIRM|nr:tRNA (N(6)-L-threonylcarbamoyladenosine(37)-C(2))-methylthiotransferase MtaB [Syntrophomonas zehnderi]CFX99134.1 Methylthiotransferase [Syntrophomonas zehnderi OL-4]